MKSSPTGGTWTYRPEIGGVYSTAGQQHPDGKPRTCIADTGEAGQTWNGAALPEEEKHANGHLIAAAPDLRTALEAFEQGPPDGDNIDAWFAQYAVNLQHARAALIKAEGGAS